MDEREKKLPKWAQELIADLRKRIEMGDTELLTKMISLRSEIQQLKSKLYDRDVSNVKKEG
jgi:galactokinase/mevalonate kinase-like predicted kinase